jgi:energy-coupling factor transporter ATP-binding protein EcfA2
VPDQSQTADLAQFLSRVSDVLGNSDLELPEPERKTLAALVDNGLLPRLLHPAAPLKVVFAGPTGSGKSTLINSVAGRHVTRSGVLRPTTTKPLIYAHAEHQTVISTEEIPYDMVSGISPILDSLSLIDTPDLDSTNVENRRRALDAISRADAVVFVTSALRYADLVPWEVFRDVAARGVPVVFVINRISSSTPGVVTDFRRRARREGFSMTVVRVEEHHLESDGLLPGASVRDLRRAIVGSIPSASEAQYRIDEGVRYVVDTLEKMRTTVGEREASVLGLREEVENAITFPTDFDISRHRARWLDRLSATSRWQRRSNWVETIDWISADIATELTLAMERDLSMVAGHSARIEIDLRQIDPTLQPDSAGVSRLVEAWIESVPPAGPVTHMSYRFARKKIENIVSCVSLLIDSELIHQTPELINVARELRIDIDKLYEKSLAALASLRREREAAEIDLLLATQAIRPEPIVANA